MLIVLKLEDGIITCGDEDFNYPYLAESLQPIPLTPDILEKAGFVEQLIDWMDVYTIRLEDQFYNGLEYAGCEMLWHDDGSIFLADRESGSRNTRQNFNSPSPSKPLLRSDGRGINH